MSLVPIEARGRTGPLAVGGGRIAYASGCHVIVSRLVGSGLLDSRVCAFGTAGTPAGASPSRRSRVKPITAVSLTSDGKFLAAGETGPSPRLGLWNIDDLGDDVNAPLWISLSHSFGISFLRFSDSGSRLCSVGTTHDGFVHVFGLTKNAAVCLATNRVTSEVRAVRWLSADTVLVLGVRLAKTFRLAEDAHVGNADDESLRQIAVLEARQIILGKHLSETFIGAMIYDGRVRLVSASGVLGFVCKTTRSFVPEALVQSNLVAAVSWHSRLVFASQHGLSTCNASLSNSPIDSVESLGDDLVLGLEGGGISVLTETSEISLIESMELAGADGSQLVTRMGRVLDGETAWQVGKTVTCIAKGPVIGTEDGCVLDETTSPLLLHESSVRAIATDGILFASYSGDRKLAILHRSATGELDLIQTWSDARSSITWAGVVDRHNVLVATLDRTLKLLARTSDVEAFEVRTASDLKATVITGAIDGELLFLACRDKTIITGGLSLRMTCLTRLDDVADALCISHEHLICASSLGRSVIVLNKLTSRQIARQDHIGALVTVEGLTGDLFRTATEDGQIRVWKIVAPESARSTSPKKLLHFPLRRSGSSQSVNTQTPARSRVLRPKEDNSRSRTEDVVAQTLANLRLLRESHLHPDDRAMLELASRFLTRASE
ncbi:hypothetical protein PYCC9005_005241 [Savitreella phatthalungensis]